MREAMLILHFIGLVMGMGTGLGHAFLGSATKKMTADEATRFRLHTLVLGKMGNIGIILLVISGFYLITPYWGMLSSLPLLIVKLSLVFILIILIIMINVLGRRAKLGNPEVQFKKMALLGKFTLLISVAIVIVAVSVFH